MQHWVRWLGRTVRPSWRGMRLRWWLLLLVASVAFACFAWTQTRTVVSFDLRSDAPVRLQVFYSVAGGFSERDSTHVVAYPDAGGHVRVRVPATHTGQLRLDPAAAARPFDVCRLRAGGGDGAGYRPGLQNELAWAPRERCTHIVPDPASTDPYIVMVSERAPASIAEVRSWRRTARLATALSFVLLVFTIRRLSVPGTPLSLWAERMFAVVSRRAHWLALALMVVMGSLIAHALPPNGVPDEIAHMSKVAKVGAGVLLRDSGPVPVADVLAMYAHMNDVREPAVIDPTVLSTALERPLACDRAARTLPPMADAYAPHLYAVPAAVLSASCALDTSFGTFLVLSRILNLIFAAALIAIGIRYAVAGKWALVAVALLPMTLAQAASVSADSLTLGLSFCFIGLVSGVAGGGLSPSRVRYWLPILALLLAFAKPGAAWILIAILFCRSAYPVGDRSFAWAVVSVLVVPWLVHATWVVMSSTDAIPLPGVDPGSNMALLRNDPVAVARLAFNTFFGPHGEFIYKSTIGLLGWLDIPLSGWAYALGTIGLAGSLWANDRRPAQPLLVRPLALAAAAGSIAMLSLPLYLYWTHPTAGVVMGLQGRYFLPTLAFILVWMAMPSRAVVRLALLAVILALPVLTLDAVRQINDRYYLVGL